MRAYAGNVRMLPMTEATIETAKELTLLAKVGNQLRENRVEAMIVTILLYSTGVLEKAVIYGAGVC